MLRVQANLTKTYQGQAGSELRIVVGGAIHAMSMYNYTKYIENLTKEGDVKDGIDEIAKCIADTHGIKNFKD